MTRAISIAAAALLLGACASNPNSVAVRGDPVGVNAVDRSMPVTGAVQGGINPSPTTMATTTSSGVSTTR